ncbi:MAG: putative peptidoglycan glycosyltransferase FtsW [Cyanobacteria bacterium P01_A01_bin.135]
MALSTATVIRYLFPFIDVSARRWAFEARLLRWLTLIWLMVGLIVLFSASYVVADAEKGDGLYYFKMQLIWVFLGLVIFNTVTHLPIKVTLGLSPLLYAIVSALIIATLLPGVGVTVNGATRWLVIGPLGIQPSELIKPMLILQGAHVFGLWHHLRLGTRLSWIVFFVGVTGCILMQPNLSTAALCGLVLWGIALASDIPLKFVSSAAVGGFAVAALSASLREYQRRRLISFLNPWEAPTGDGYQLIQSLLAIGSGGFWGTGLGFSYQKLFYLPIQYTDFIFAVFAEEFGFIGAIFFLSLLLLYATIGLRIALRATRPVHQLLALGAVLLLVGQSILNIGVASGVLPTTGLPLPLMSYGGSSMLGSLAVAGILVRVARESCGAEVVALT